MILFWVGLGAITVAFVISLLATRLSQRVAARVGMMDVPQRHKAHTRPTPLLGGCAIVAAILGPSLLVLSVARVWMTTEIPAWVPRAVIPYIGGVALKAPDALVILGGLFAMHVLGLIDDRKNLGPWLKLLAQFVIASLVVAFCEDVRLLGAIGPAWSNALTVIWLVAITNSFNFLDNMDGLSAGVAAICTAALLGAAASIGQVFVSAWLCLLLGALLGFLPYNFPPAGSFMGDSGSLVIGYMLAVLTCLTTYVPEGTPMSAYEILVPVVLMAVPLYDMLSVITIRIRSGRNPLVGDRRHFSHRLLGRGMSVRAAMLTIWLCTAGTTIAASLLPRVKDTVGAVLVFAQTIAILMIIALLESGDARPNSNP